MIDIVQHRCRIGQFGQKILSTNFLLSFYKFESESCHEKKGKNILSSVQFAMKFLMFLVMVSSLCFEYPAWTLSSSGLNSECTMAAMDSAGQVVGIMGREILWNMNMLGNFWANC